MSILNDLKAKSTEVTLSNGAKISITPLTVDEEISVANFQRDEKFFEAMSFIVKSAIKRAIPDVTDEEINCLNKEDLKTISRAVQNINGLDQKEE